MPYNSGNINYYQPYANMTGGITGGYNQYQPTYQQPYQQNLTNNYSPTTLQSINQNQCQTLYGKVVDGIEIVKSQEVPIGFYGIYPKADGSCIYVKSWLQDGTTKIDEYLINNKTDDKNIVNLNDIQLSIDKLSKKIDEINKTSSSVTRKKKVEEVDYNES